MKNKGIKIGVVFILLFALLSVAGCQQEDVVIVGVEPGTAGAYKRAAAHFIRASVVFGKHQTITKHNLTTFLCQQICPSPLRIRIPMLRPC